MWFFSYNFCCCRMVVEEKNEGSKAENRRTVGWNALHFVCVCVHGKNLACYQYFHSAMRWTVLNLIFVLLYLCWKKKKNCSAVFCNRTYLTDFIHYESIISQQKKAKQKSSSEVQIDFQNFNECSFMQFIEVWKSFNFLFWSNFWWSAYCFCVYAFI